jgi:hypothetical protein
MAGAFHMIQIYPSEDYPDFSYMNEPHPIEAQSLASAHPVMAFYRYWLSLNDGKIPHRAMFNPFKVPSALPWIILFEQVSASDDPEAEPDYRVRLHGSGISAVIKASWKGRLLSQQMDHAVFLKRCTEFKSTLDSGQPQFSRGDMIVNHVKWVITRGIFPMHVEGGRPQIFFLGVSEKHI